MPPSLVLQVLPDAASYRRFERVNLLQARGQWKEGDRGLGLRKTKPEA